MRKPILVLGLAAALTAGAAAETVAPGRRFEWTTRSSEAKARLAELQQRIESFQFGPPAIELARAIVAADPGFAMGEYYLSAVLPPPGSQAHLDRAVLLSKTASDGERRFIEAMVVARANQGASFRDAIPALEALAVDYPGERLVHVILGQIHQGANDLDRAGAAFRRAEEIGPPSPRVRAFLANEDLVAGRYAKAREAFLEVERSLPKGAAPFAVRYGLAFSHLYEGRPDAAIAALETYLAEYRDSGAADLFGFVLFWK
jgi:tetratricopeptide (TPR) repeat protein